MNNHIKNSRWWDFTAAALLVAALASVSVRLNNTDWTRYLEITEIIVIIGCILGLALGYTRFSSKIAFMIALLYGVVIVPWQVSRVADNSGQTLTWLQQFQIIFDRLQVVIFQLLRNEVVQDSIFFIVLMATLFWILGVSAGYILIRRGNAWLALLPSGIALLVIHLFDPLKDRRIWYFAAYIFFSLMLVGRVAFLHNQDRWQRTRTAMPPYLGLDFIRFSFFATTAIIILAWIFPTIPSTLPSIKEITEPVQQQWKDFQEQFDNVFASLKTTLNVPVDYYGSTLTLGSGNKLSDEIMFWVQSPSTIPDGVRLYWRARIYSTFNGRQWALPPFVSNEWLPDSELSLSTYNQRWEAEFGIISSSFFTSLLVPAEPQWTSRPGFVEFVNNPDTSIDLISFRADPLVRPGQVYTVISSISNAEIYDMRTSSVDYPDWIRDRYLALPPTTTSRTIQLAEEITFGLDNPYDKTMAITQFLRDNIAYSEIIPPPPVNQDAVDWFLFENQTGFCNYFASATVIMARAVGIPARMVVGYATGEEQANDRYVVRQSQAHAWPEIYFNELGWVEFEPTPSQPVIDRLPGEDPNSDNSPLTSPAIPLSGPTPVIDDDLFNDRNRGDAQPLESDFSGRNRIVFFLIITTILTILIVIFYRLKNRFNLKPFPVILEGTLNKAGLKSPGFLQNWVISSTLPQLTKSYMEINRALSRSGIYLDPTATPAERAQALNFQIPLAEPFINLVVYEYQLGLFSEQPPDILSALQASRKIRQLSYQDYVNRIIQRLKTLPIKSKKKRDIRFLK